MLPSAGSLLKCWLRQSCPELGTGMAGSHGLEHDWLPARGHISKKLELGLPQEHSPVTLLWVHIANGTLTAVSNAYHCSYPHISQIHTYLSCYWRSFPCMYRVCYTHNHYVNQNKFSKTKRKLAPGGSSERSRTWACHPLQNLT